MGRRAAALAAVVVFSVLAAAPRHVGAQDSMAPAGASPHFLPKEDWVYRHWPPFDEQLLADRLGLGDGELEAYLFDDHRSLDTLATLRGVDLESLVDTLSAWADGLSPDRRDAVRDRTLRVLTQPHLAQHLFFHVYHGVDARAAAPALFHMAPRRYWHLRLRGLTPRQTASAGGVGPRHVESGLTESFAVDRDTGVDLQVTPPSEAERMYSRRVAQLPCWMTRPLPALDRASPYAHEEAMHGRWYHHMPMTAAERRAGGATVERFRRSLPHSCFPRPGAWDWSAHGLRAP